MEEITNNNVKKAVQLDHKHDSERSLMEKMADKINDFAGSVSFIITHLIIFSLWIGYNVIAGDKGFDPYPFTFLTMSVSLEAIFLSSLLLISQNKSGEKQDRRHQLDLQINLLSEQENTAMLRVLSKMAEKLKVDSSELDKFINETKPEEMIIALEAEEKKKAQ